MTNILTLRRMGTFCLVLLLSFNIQAQFSFQKHSFILEPVGEFKAQETERIFAPSLTPQEMHHPDGELDRQWSRSALRAQRFNKVANDVVINPNTPRPEVLDSLAGNAYSGSVPNDNDFAIGINQQMVRVRNSTIGVYDYSKDSLLFETTLFRFYRPTAILPGSKYDPRALYDPVADRFIVLYLSGNTWENSKIIVAFSKSNDLADGFNIYQIDGNPLNDSTWSDYPHISINRDDLFITMNTFYNGSSNNSGYVQSTIRQLDKQAGYDSLPMIEHYYSNLKMGNRNLFNFTGMDRGTDYPGAPAYILSNRNLDTINDSIFVVKIDGPASGNPQLSLEVYQTETPYGLPPEARQANDHTFDCNDSRIQGGFVAHGTIQYVGNTITSLGNSGIYHGMIKLDGPKTNSYFKIINFDPIDIGYPQITYTGKSYAEMEAIISFNHTGDSLNAGFSCMFFDNDSSYSPRKQIVEGGDYIDIISSNGNRKYERWGDYTGNQQAYGETGTAWASGYEATANGQPLTAIAKLRSPNWQDTPINIGLKENSLQSTVAPNPAIDWFELKLNQEKEEVLSFRLMSLDGKQNQALFEVQELALAGQNSFRFKTNSLKTGVYLLVVQGADGRRITDEKILITK
ncbi:T9SS type A sorting domain-containing protein [Croceimicrobium hydrocarbonivorans]|uniref:T9SS type A sorting domain-containing protein n=1 Tax=Croceimicrobium hydrocarbonivorans TaxID=2761580 RepID=A0A7H0VHT4_9FLAO|nr:T9SS type A sorting domain-containing protein [Croceimicrobium hydrocarbonivorans]QNR25282.1 T9SS type A sorting domain-containing protein [Croceimicrobium hydrocarbonivorans]